MEGESEGDDDAADSDDDEEEESEEEEEEESSGSDGGSKGRRKRVRRERVEMGQPFKYADTGEADTTLVLRQLVGALLCLVIFWRGVFLGGCWSGSGMPLTTHGQNHSHNAPWHGSRCPCPFRTTQHPPT